MLKFIKRYVKLEKLKVIVELASEENIIQVLEEFLEYSNNINKTFLIALVEAIEKLIPKFGNMIRVFESLIANLFKADAVEVKERILQSSFHLTNQTI